MKNSASIAVSVLSLTPTVFSAISLSISKDPPLNPKFGARDSIDEPLINEVIRYKASIEVGTPPQAITVQIDTGSSDLWVFENTAAICEAQFCPDGSFDPTASSTFQEVVPDGFFISYVDNSAAQGDYVADSFSFGEGGTLTGLQFGMVKAANGTIVSGSSAFGIMGIGHSAGEATRDIYPNIPDQLVAQGLIDAKAYSLHLDDILANEGSILFGGIDTDKFIGTLNALPVQADENGGFTRLNVLLSSLSLTTGGESSQLLAAPVAASLDSGASYTVLDDDIVTEIFESLGAFDDTEGISQQAWVGCDVRCTRYDDEFSFGFGSADGPVIKVPVAETLRGPFQIPDGLSLPASIPVDNACVVTLQRLGSLTIPIYILGDPFLRSAYAVFDLENNEIALAQSNYESTAENIQDIPKGSTSIPLLSGLESGVTKLPLEASCPPPSSSSTAPPTSSSTGTSTKPPTTTPSTISGGEGPTTTPSSTASPTSWSNSTITTSHHSTITSTKTTTTVYTVTSCPPTVTHCPVGDVTTEIIEITTTFCPGETAVPTLTLPHKPHGSTTSSITRTTIYTVTSCAPTMTACPIGKETTELIITTTVCPVTESELPTLLPTTTLVPTTYPGGSATSTGGGVAPTGTTLPFTGGVDRVTAGGGFSLVVALLFGLIAI